MSVAAGAQVRLGPTVSARVDRFAYWIPWLALFIATPAIYGVGAAQPSLFGDDWGHLAADAVQGQLSCPDTGGIFYRPLEPCLPLAIDQLLRHNIAADIAADHAVKLGLLSLIPLLLCGFVLTVAPGERLLAFLTAALYVVVPTVFVQNWAVLAPYDLGLLLILVGMIVAVKATRSGSVASVALAAGLFTLSLLIYELPLGALCFFSAMLIVFAFRNGRLPLWAASLPMALCAAYLVGRSFAEILFGDPWGFSRSSFTLSASELILKVLTAYKILLESSWGAAVDRIWSVALGGSATGHASVMAISLFAIIVLATYTAARFADRRVREIPDDAARSSRMKRSATMAAIGLIAIAPGFFPVLIAAAPSLAWEPSRLNIPATIGLVIFIASSIELLATLVAKSAVGRRVSFASGVTVLLLAGGFSQLIVQLETRAAWEDQKTIWQQLFRSAPDFAPATTVIFALPKGNDPAIPGPFQSGLDAASQALREFYGRPDLQGSFQYGSQDPARLYDDGVSVTEGRTLIPYSHVVMFQYDQATRTLRRLHAVGQVPGAPTTDQVFCEQCVMAGPATNTSLRQLVD